MKNFNRLFAAVLLMVVVMTFTVSCAETVKGTYYLGDREYTNTYVELKFKGTSLTISQITIGKTVWQTKAEYSIADDVITIRIPEDANQFAKVYDGEFTLEQGDDYIKIGAFEYQLLK